MKKNVFAPILVCLFLTAFPVSAQNDEVPESRPFQLSVFPFVGTEGVNSHKYVYDVSLNLFGGVTGGVDGIEFGGFLNINRYSVTGLQASGFGNITGGEVDGVQFSGFFNLSGSNVKGIQGAGFLNIVNGDARVLQGAGFGNIISGNSRGLQGSGFAGITSGNFEGVQASGFSSVTGGKLSGVQISGFAGIAGEVDGVQGSGFANVAGRVEGIQVAGIVNVAGNVKGVQIGVVNIADSVDGFPIGLVSIVRDGYQKVEFWGGDAMNLGIGIKTGVRRFYNFLTLGAQFLHDNTVISYGYGIGSEFILRDERYLNVEIISHYLMENRWWEYDRINVLNQLRVTYATDIDNRWQFFAGPVLNVQVVRAGSEGNSGTRVAPYHIFEFSSRHTDTWVWAGINAGFRFW
ncbi:MAG: hypothetical protein EA408_09060 [Marinilabiliales bacterium]|nr:MAG: hypothetical protein EA408_09060 [Marinilabiliales bacterium]